MLLGRKKEDVTEIIEAAFRPFVGRVATEDYKRFFRVGVLSKDGCVITEFPPSEKTPCPFELYQKNDTELKKLVQHVRDLLEKQELTLEPWELPGGVKY